jgi:uncharacterized protein involved in exopolysaccharide biosynthesis
MDQQQKEINLRDYIDVILKRKALIFLSVAVVTLTCIIFIPAKKVNYQATAFIIVERPSRRHPLMESIKRFVKSNTLAKEVLRKIEFERAAIVKTRGELSGISTRDLMPDTLLASLEVVQQESDILNINASMGKPHEAQYLANLVAEVIVDQSMKGIASGTQGSLRYVESQLETLSKKIDETKHLLAEYTVSADEGDILTSEEAAELERLQQDYIDARLNRQMAATRLKVLEEKLELQEGGEEAIFSILPRSPELDKLKKDLAKLEKEKSSLLIQFTEEHPNVIEVQYKIDRTKELIELEIRRPLEDLRKEIAEYQSQEDSLQKIIDKRFPLSMSGGDGQKSLNFEIVSRLKRDLNMHQKTYDGLQNAKHKLTVDVLLNATRVRILRLATLPEEPMKTQGAPPVLIALSLGLVLGLTAAFIQESMDTSLKTIEDIEQYVNLPLMGVVPLIRPTKKGEEK